MWDHCNYFFGCNHRALSWPRTRRKPGKRTYVVCLSCGTEFDYDFTTMRRRSNTTQITPNPDGRYAIQ